MPETPVTPAPLTSAVPVSPRTRRSAPGRWRDAIRSTPPGLVIGVLAIAAVVLVAVFLTIDLKGNIAYILPRRAIKVSAMLLVAVAVGVSTLLFQTVTANRILTPSIMGFDSLYILVQTALAFVAGAATLATAPSTLKFGLEILLMVGFSAFLYRWMFTGPRGPCICCCSWGSSWEHCSVAFPRSCSG
jgi:iron complex transport system permease protein